MPFFRKTEKAPEGAPATSDSLADIRRQIEAAHFPPAAEAVAGKELDRLQYTDPSLPEYAIGLNYLEFLLSLPWQRFK